MEKGSEQKRNGGEGEKDEEGARGKPGDSQI